ncbi:hypothetical protein [Amycolatopsis jiangsuensis]|uniref:Lipoprotein n=1 Tax=Amycolatopsis jiangsuensis TaxID=1181879 RepID=A0A840J294_9PSEU|nr:hypothetical protein [Amycolatopsis jiangsuensis]MBB4687765.1 hypothetical protein [Amycolatopsis jiangsuensis]
MSRVAAGVLTMAAVAAVSACGVEDAVVEHGNGHVKAVSHQSGIDGKNDAEAKLPDWVPDGAQQVEELIRTTGAERLLKYSPAGTTLPAVCKPGTAEPKPPTLTADWWPAGEHLRTDQLCDGWHVAVERDAVYAYRVETVSGTGAN